MEWGTRENRTSGSKLSAGTQRRKNHGLHAVELRKYHVNLLDAGWYDVWRNCIMPASRAKNRKSREHGPGRAGQVRHVELLLPEPAVHASAKTGGMEREGREGFPCRRFHYWQVGAAGGALRDSLRPPPHGCSRRLQAQGS